MVFNYIIIPTIFCQLPPSIYVYKINNHTHICYAFYAKLKISIFFLVNNKNFHHKKINKKIMYFLKRNEEEDDDSYDDKDDETKQATTIFQFKSISCE